MCAKRLQNDNTLLIIISKFIRDLGLSICGAFTLLFLDVVLFGSYLFSFPVCSIWFLVSILKNAIQRPGWKLAIIRISFPALTLALVLANNSVQLRIAESNAARIIKACEEFRAANGELPKTLDELVPEYLPSIPLAKYCLVLGEFRYWNRDEEHPTLTWYVVPPYCRKIYDYEERRWSILD
jgi:hypothetical protein